jgi:hypothetical protein
MMLALTPALSPGRGRFVVCFLRYGDIGLRDDRLTNPNAETATVPVELRQSARSPTLSQGERAGVRAVNPPFPQSQILGPRSKIANLKLKIMPNPLMSGWTKAVQVEF